MLGMVICKRSSLGKRLVSKQHEVSDIGNFDLIYEMRLLTYV